MQVKELAELAGTTVRAVRHYHHAGLLPVPVVRDGRRDYDLRHVARLSRIRWLAQAGVPLSRISGMLDAQPGGHDGWAESEGVQHASVVADLQATVSTLDEQLERLQEQRKQVVRLLAVAARGEHLSPMPAAVTSFYDDMERRADDDGTRRAVRHERDFMELAFYRGDIPPEAALVYETFEESRRSESMAVFDRMADRSPGAVPSEQELEEIAAAVVARIHNQLGPAFEPLARSVDLELARRAADLYVQVGRRQDRRRNRAVADAVVGAVEAARS
ncbi:MerR family transcriptional regulator [Cellulomonas fengjieae]|uniref:MerR family transcriptional regulator n=1 Tax=Cellulomonas fengjieae TaxID=2819978 RepID=A0ABS3SKI8_9CELL|nr:MerR family transcriptional regulator [Cellulomonas fengjieae]MBO3086262.1 MerR family transcriptional regulator [Cellulomonas fengjieae]MBO3102332.1 MerR family transcriptional regulator [Cellulomonas fengjieae]QVI65693.1 MerR family transcriptional regulator [Cellulomonas fengjieae]